MLSSKKFPRKRFGQHWLIDESVLAKIIRSADIQACDRILEIGPGRGALTKKLLDSPADFIHAIEVDRDLVYGLKQRFLNEKRFYLQEGDFLSISLKPMYGIPLNKVVANIPYNITSPLLEKLIGNLGCIPQVQYEKLVLLMQKEVADRITSMPGTTDFSAMSVRMQLLAKTSGICDVPPKCFKPAPKVNSKVVVIEPLKLNEREEQDTEKMVDVLVKKAFSARRKKLKNTLVSLKPLSDLEPIADSLGINLNKRPQELSPMMWVNLAKAILYKD